MWDVGGQKTLRAYWRNYFEATDALVWVVDSSDGARLADCAAELAALLREERLAGATLLVLANKQDIAAALALPALAAALGLEALARGGRHARCVACSAVTGAGLLPAFDWLVADVASRVYLMD